MSSTDTEKEYWETVEAIAEECHREGYDPHEQVESNYWVTYTHAAHKVWTYSPNDDAVFDDGEGLAGCESMAEALTRMAFYAMLADVQARIAEMEDAAEDEDEDEDEDTTDSIEEAR
jgi:hypothetical protein